MRERKLLFSPSLLGSDFSSPIAALDEIALSGAEYVHLDVMDGNFVPNISFGAKFISDIRPHSDLIFDVHLMIDHPERMIDSFLEAGSGIITIHTESTEHAWRAMTMASEGGAECGIAINPGTSISSIEPLLDIADYVLVMSVNPGWGGQAFIPESMKKVEELSLRRENDDYDYLIAVDGGVSRSNIVELYKRGMDIAVMGSAFFREKDKRSFIQEMRREAEIFV